MKLVITSSELLKGLLIVSKAIPTKPVEAILENYLFCLKGNILEVTASDNEITLKTEIPVERTDEEGRIAVPARQITDLLKELPDEPLTISTLSDSSFEMAWQSGASQLPYFNPDDYPQIKLAGEGASKIMVPSESLLDGISSTIYAASDDPTRAIMNSIFFDITPDSTTFVASDLQKLICYTVDDVKAEKDCSLTLNKRHAAIIKSIITKDSGDIELTFDESTAVFKFDDTTIICKLVVGKYPAYKTIIPKNNSNVMRIDRVQLLNTVRRIAVCSPKASNHIKFDLKSGSIEVSAQDVGFEIAGHEKIACQYDGEDLTIGFKSTHIIEILSNLSCDEVVMKFADKRRSALILPSEEEAASEKTFGIVMPIMVR
jgi:DNA polymerase-3 subunit beta